MGSPLDPKAPQVGRMHKPYRRAKQTAELIGSVGGIAEESPELIVDERLREKEFGILDRLTRAGIERSHPQQAEFRRLASSTTGRPVARAGATLSCGYAARSTR